MKEFLPRLKKPFLWALLLTAFSLLWNFLMVRYTGSLLAPVFGGMTEYFRGLSTARIRWEPLWMPLAALLGFVLLCIPKKHFRWVCVLTGILLLFAGLLLMRVNGIPMLKVISVVISLLKGGVL